jgi:hypothetical protein
MSKTELETSIELMKKIAIGSRVLYRNKWYTVTGIEHCHWQGKEGNQKDQVCYYCVGRIILDNKRDRDCWCYNNKIEIDDVIQSDFFIDKKEFMLS